MANADTPKGLWPVDHLTGGAIRSRRYIVTASATCYRGEILKAVAGGTVEPAAAADAGICMGVAAEYKVAAATGTTYIEVWDDPMIVFGVQASTAAGALDQTCVFATGDHIKTHSGSTTTGISGDELGAIAEGQLKVLGILDTPDNAWGTNVKLKVIFNEHLYKYPVAAV